MNSHLVHSTSLDICTTFTCTRLKVFLRQPINVEDLDKTYQYFQLLNECGYIPDMYCKNFETCDYVEKDLVLSGKKNMK